MAKRKPVKEVLKDYSEKELTEILVEELKAVGIEYTIDPNGHGTSFIPLEMED